MSRCAHFRTHWTVVTDATGTWSIRYCTDCGDAVESRQGASIARHHQHVEALQGGAAPSPDPQKELPR